MARDFDKQNTFEMQLVTSLDEVRRLVQDALEAIKDDCYDDVVSLCESLHGEAVGVHIYSRQWFRDRQGALE